MELLGEWEAEKPSCLVSFLGREDHTNGRCFFLVSAWNNMRIYLMVRVMTHEAFVSLACYITSQCATRPAWAAERGE